MMIERRKVKRVPAAIPVRWGAEQRKQQSGVIVSLSSRGCFLETTTNEPLSGRIISIRFPLPNEDVLMLQGEILYFYRNSGFAIKFTGLTAEDKATLMQLVRHIQRNQ